MSCLEWSRRGCHRHLAARRYRVTRRINRPVSVVVLMTALLVLPIVAFTSPPDPVWVPGIYDGADGDDVVTLVTETAAFKDENLCQSPLPTFSSEPIVIRELGGRESLPELRPPRGPPQTPPASADCVRGGLEPPPTAHRFPSNVLVSLSTPEHTRLLKYPSSDTAPLASLLELLTRVTGKGEELVSGSDVTTWTPRKSWERNAMRLNRYPARALALSLPARTSASGKAPA